MLAGGSTRRTSEASITDSGISTQHVGGSTRRTSGASHDSGIAEPELSKKKRRKAKKPAPTEVRSALVVSGSNLKSLEELPPMLRRLPGDCTRPKEFTYNLWADTDRACTEGIEDGLYRYGLIICTSEEFVVAYLQRRNLVKSKLTMTTGQRAYQVKARNGSSRMPLVVVVSVKYATWDLELHNLLSQVGLEDKVIPVLIDVSPEKEKLKMHAALRLHGGLRFTFLLSTSATPAHVDFVLDNLRTEMVAVRGAPHIKMFSKTDYSKGVVMSVAIEQCVSIYEKLIMSADEYMQIQKSYGRFLEQYLLPAQKHLLNGGSDTEAYLAKGYNVVDLATGKLQWTDENSILQSFLCVPRRCVLRCG